MRGERKKRLEGKQPLNSSAKLHSDRKKKIGKKEKGGGGEPPCRASNIFSSATPWEGVEGEKRERLGGRGKGSRSLCLFF